MSPRQSSAKTNPKNSAPPAPDPAERRVTALQEAARARHESARARAEAGICQLLERGEEVSFRAIARAGGVGVDFLYSEPALRKRIEDLRARQHTSPRVQRQPEEPHATDAGNVARTLSAQLKTERARHRETLRDLEERLPAAHAEILRLRRALGPTAVDES